MAFDVITYAVSKKNISENREVGKQVEELELKLKQKADANEVNSELNNKVDKIAGKGLSTNDFTDADKSKLDNLENYDDADVKTEIAEVASQAAINKTTLEYQRKNLLKNTATSQTINGITFTVNEDKSVTVNGTATADAVLRVNINTADITNNSSYNSIILTGSPNGAGINKFALGIEFKQNGNYIHYIETYNSGKEYKIGTTNHDSSNVYIKIWSNQTVNDKTFYPMLRYAEITDDTYEPYKLSVEERLAALETKIAALEGGTT